MLEWQRSRKSSGTAGTSGVIVQEVHVHHPGTDKCTQDPAPNHAARTNTPSVCAESPGESHNIGCGGVLEGVGEAIARKAISGEGEKEERLPGVKGALGSYTLKLFRSEDGCFQFRAQSRHSHSWSNKKPPQRTHYWPI